MSRGSNCGQKFESLGGPDRKCLNANEKKRRALGDDFRTQAIDLELVVGELLVV